MAIYPSNFTAQDKLSPGSRGEIFQADLPGYRDGADRMGRTNTNFNTNAHDTTNIKWEFDRRLKPLFKNFWAYGYNQIVMPKGRIVAVDPNLDYLNHEMFPGVRVDRTGNAGYSAKSFNALTLANGGVPVRLREATDTYQTTTDSNIVSPDGSGAAVHGVGKEWIPLQTLAVAYDKETIRPFNIATTSGGTTTNVVNGGVAILQSEGYEIDEQTGMVKVTATSAIAPNVRPANTPIGIIGRNEYTRDDDAFNGIAPGPVLTDCMVELPWFYFKDKAEQNPWGSAYGNLFPGALVKSDENGRFVLSPLNYVNGGFESTLDLDAAEIELERQQVIGQVYSTNRDLLPEGAARWATWALADRRNFETFNPDVYRRTNRAGEDNIANSPYNSTGEYPGYPFDNTLTEHDLHMINSNRPYDKRMNDEYEYDNLGIPGLTDGKNAVVRQYPYQESAVIKMDATATQYVDVIMKTTEVDVQNLMIKIDNGTAVACVDGAVVTASDGTNSGTFARVKYANALQGIVVLEITSASDANTYMASKTEHQISVKLAFAKRGVSGVPTFMDWDGCMGSVKILLTK